LEALSHHAVFLISVEAGRQLIAEIIMLPKNLFCQTLIENSKGQPHKREAALFLRCSLPPLMMALSWAVLYDLAAWFVNRKEIGAGRGSWLEEG
jgi:hypothetical protein